MRWVAIPQLTSRSVRFVPMNRARVVGRAAVLIEVEAPDAGGIHDQVAAWYAALCERRDSGGLDAVDIVPPRGPCCSTGYPTRPDSPVPSGPGRLRRRGGPRTGRSSASPPSTTASTSPTSPSAGTPAPRAPSSDTRRLSSASRFWFRARFRLPQRAATRTAGAAPARAPGQRAGRLGRAGRRVRGDLSGRVAGRVAAAGPHGRRPLRSFRRPAIDAAPRYAGAVRRRPMIDVLRAGALTTVQDAGRAGHAHLGVPAAGALDGPALRLANRLVGNPPATAGLEITVTGCRLRVRHTTIIAVTGAPVARLTVDGRSVDTGVPVPVPAGAVVDVGPTRSGFARTWPSPAESTSPPVLGSRSTDTLSGLGPPALRDGDVLPVGAPHGPAAPVWFTPAPRPLTDRPAADQPRPARRLVHPRGAGHAHQRDVHRLAQVQPDRGPPGRPEARPAADGRTAQRRARAGRGAGTGRRRAAGVPRRPPDHRRLSRHRGGRGGRPAAAGPVPAGRERQVRKSEDRTPMDLNADLGEGFGRWELGDDDALLGIVTSANVACGFHAGDPLTMRPVCARRGPAACGRRAGVLPRPGRFRPPLHRLRTGRADGRRPLPTGRARRDRAGGRNVGSRTSSRTARSTTRRPATRTGGRGRRRGGGVRPGPGGAGPARFGAAARRRPGPGSGASRRPFSTAPTRPTAASFRAASPAR